MVAGGKWKYERPLKLASGEWLASTYLAPCHRPNHSYAVTRGELWMIGDGELNNWS